MQADAQQKQQPPRFPHDRLVRLPEVLHRVGYKRSRFLDLVRQGVFPRPVKLGARAVAWPESQIDALVERLASGQGAAHE
ncbi:helix-turn-helix transcriptional regulator [Fundidesulfovibrio agrisoli]|uniref:helix-turn-helix transcriptional regulator n=1 Tax=Fundidesulfovibrio agrisoli TaxID=2922717 RepID=UPI003C3030C9